MEGSNFYDIMPVDSMVHNIRFDEAKPFHIVDAVKPIYGTDGRIANLPSVRVGRTSDNLFAIATLPGFIDEYKGKVNGGYNYRFFIQHNQQIITHSVTDRQGHAICYNPIDNIARWISANFDEIYLTGVNSITGTQNKISNSCRAVVNRSLQGMPSSSNERYLPSYTLLNMDNGTPEHASITKFSGFIKISMKIR